MINEYQNLYNSIKEYPYAQAEILKKTFLYAFFAQLEGDYLEFGVYKGENFSMAYHFAKFASDPAILKENPNTLFKNYLEKMNFYAFDSFEGLSKLTEEDLEGYKQPDFEENSYACDIDTFKGDLLRNEVDLSKVHIVKGFYAQTLNNVTKKDLLLKNAAIVYIDCDLYSSTVSVLNFITDYLIDGSVIIFDDWFSYRGNPKKGEQRAFREWLEKNPKIKVSEFQKFSWHGNSFIVHK